MQPSAPDPTVRRRSFITAGMLFALVLVSQLTYTGTLAIPWYLIIAATLAVAAVTLIVPWRAPSSQREARPASYRATRVMQACAMSVLVAFQVMLFIPVEIPWPVILLAVAVVNLAGALITQRMWARAMPEVRAESNARISSVADPAIAEHLQEWVGNLEGEIRTPIHRHPAIYVLAGILFFSLLLPATLRTAVAVPLLSMGVGFITNRLIITRRRSTPIIVLSGPGAELGVRVMRILSWILAALVVGLLLAMVLIAPVGTPIRVFTVAGLVTGWLCSQIAERRPGIWAHLARRVPRTRKSGIGAMIAGFAIWSASPFAPEAAVSAIASLGILTFVAGIVVLVRGRHRASTQAGAGPA